MKLCVRCGAPSRRFFHRGRCTKCGAVSTTSDDFVDDKENEMIKDSNIVDHHEEMPAGLNDGLVIRHDARDPKSGNASHQYTVEHTESGTGVVRIQFQHGPRGEPDSTPGATDAAILSILIDRYRGFQDGPFRCRENAIVLTHFEEALHWMKARAQARHQRGVLGKLEE